jgi:S-DNA-T family DNA segregation ATPase FtsK/SpoIIIE
MAWPYLVVLLDNWEGFTDNFRDHKDGVVEQQFLRLLRDGGAVGVTVVTAGDRSLLSTARIASLVEEKLVLRFNDRDDYSLAGLSPRSMPTTVPSGRAFRSGSGDELQIALLDRDPAGPAQNAALAAIADSCPMPEGDDWSRPFRVDAQPTRIGLDAALSLRERRNAPFAILVGVGGDVLAPFWIDLEDTGSAFTIVGSPESGRSTALVSIARVLLSQGTRVVALAPRPSPLRSLTSVEGAVTVLSGQDARSPDLKAMLADPGPLALLIDDAEDVESDNASIAAFLAPGSGARALIIAGPVDDVRDAFRGFLVQARKPGTGLLMSPKSHLDATVFGAAMPRGSAFTGPPGRAHLFVRGRYASLVQMPLDETLHA